VAPSHQRLEALYLGRRQIEDRLVVHRDLARREGVAQFLGERETADRLLVHARGEDDVVALALALGLVQGDVGLLDELVVVGPRGVPDDDPDARVLLDVAAADQERRGQRLDQSSRHLLGLPRRVQSFGEVEEFVAAEAAECVGVARDLLEAPRDRSEHLVAGEMPERVVHPFEVIEVQEEHRAQPALAEHPRVRLFQPVVEEQPVGQLRQGIVQRLVGELLGEDPLLGDVAFGDDEVERVALGVAGRGPRHLDVDDPAVLSKVPLDVPRLAQLALDHSPVRLLGDADVLGIGEGRRVLPQQLLLGEPDHLAEGVVGRDHPILEVGEDHGGHVALERETEPLLVLAEPLHVLAVFGDVVAVYDYAADGGVVDGVGRDDLQLVHLAALRQRPHGVADRRAGCAQEFDEPQYHPLHVVGVQVLERVGA